MLLSIADPIDWSHLLRLPLDDLGFDHTGVGRDPGPVVGVGLE